ncbi:murein biosynthesis integral membrane protein MurJ [Kocuria sp.]|uniref:murein biosynthesis integral membrane protein MurJ n=1 Tax=Kocuria sp. TaxID=1871328 RepID=UPI0026E01B2F|nr:lipid II flippase MurJ [Kocuria sp.]MDO5618967.1 lipid II flippase MurJ [Kocuria sp.]
MARSGAVSSAIMASGTLVSRVLGFVKAILLAVALGSTSNMANVYDVADKIPNLIYVLVAAGVFNAVLVPQVIKASKNSTDDGADYISRLVTLAVIVMAVITLVVMLLAVPIMNIMTPGWDDGQRSMVITFALFTLPQIFFYGMYTVMGQVLNAKGAFGWFMWTPALNNVIAIGALLVFIQQFGSYAAAQHDLETWTNAQTFWLAAMATVGVASQALILLWPLKRLGLDLRPKFGWRGIGLSTAAKLSGWTLVTGVIANLAFLALSRTANIPNAYREEYLAASPPEVIAGNYALNQATMLYSLPHGVIGLSIATVLFNTMAAAAAEKNTAGVNAALSKALRYSGIANVFFTACLIAYAGPLGMLFSGGIQESGAVIGQVIVVIAIGAPFLTSAFLFGRIFYAQEDARTPFLVQLIVSVLTVGAAFAIQHWVAPNHMVLAIAACYAGQNILSTLIYHFWAVKRIGDYGLTEVLETHVRSLAAALVAAGLGTGVLYLMGGWDAQGWPWTSLLTSLLTLAVCGVVTGLLYLVMLKVFALKELPELTRPLVARLPSRLKR